MSTDDNNTNAEERHHHQHSRQSNNMLMVRNVLNLLFMIGAVIGVVFTLKGDRLTGMYIVAVAMALKFTESAIRLLKR